MRAVGVGVVLTLLLLETVLQVASYVAWSSQERIERPPGRVVLCIGDSLTFGFGAERSEAYPPRMEERLTENDLRLSVVNAGIPGQNSADVVHRLPELLAGLRPDAVCLLVGWNDTWARPAPVDVSQLATGGFPLRWRTGRLVRLLVARSDALAGSEEFPFLGGWHVEQHEFYFAADGTARFGALAATWTVDGDVLKLIPEGGEPVKMRWRRTERAVEFALFGWNRFQRARRGPPTNAVDIDHVSDLIQRGDLDAAIAAIPSTDDAAALAIRAEVVAGLLDVGRKADADRLIAPLQAAWERREDAVAGAAVALWLARTGKRELAIAAARELLIGHEDRVLCWRVLVDTSAGDARAELASELARAASRQTSPWRRAELTLERAVALAVSDPEGALVALAAARAIGIGSDETVQGMRRAVAQGADRSRLLGAVARLDLSAKDREALERDMRRATIDDAEMLAVLERHLQSAIELCQAAGARVFLLGYPFPMPDHEALVQRVAAARGGTFVSMVAGFDARLSSEPRAEWFVDPIHCTARGYRLMGEIVGDRLAAELR